MFGHIVETEREAWVVLELELWEARHPRMCKKLQILYVQNYVKDQRRNEPVDCLRMTFVLEE